MNNANRNRDDADEPHPEERGETPTASIARLHVLGATIWAYGGGAARIRPWTGGKDLSRFWRAVR